MTNNSFNKSNLNNQITFNSTSNQIQNNTNTTTNKINFDLININNKFEDNKNINNISSKETLYYLRNETKLSLRKKKIKYEITKIKKKRKSNFYDYSNANNNLNFYEDISQIKENFIKRYEKIKFNNNFCYGKHENFKNSYTNFSNNFSNNGINNLDSNCNFFNTKLSKLKNLTNKIQFFESIMNIENSINFNQEFYDDFDTMVCEDEYDLIGNLDSQLSDEKKDLFEDFLFN